MDVLTIQWGGVGGYKSRVSPIPPKPVSPILRGGRRWSFRRAEAPIREYGIYTVDLETRARQKKEDDEFITILGDR